VSKEFDGLVAIRQDSPPVVGLGDGENFIGSDVTAFIKYTRDVCSLSASDLFYMLCARVA
jgi:glucosamine--fructose-6-phosphate aminotransferase (isomerizing)